MNSGIDEIAIKTQTVRVGEINLFALKYWAELLFHLIWTEPTCLPAE
jgi:hypothetical protein